MAQWIPACELRATDVLEFHAEAIKADDGRVVSFDGIPITKLTRHRDGRISVDVTYIDGTRRFKTFAPDDQVGVRDR